MMKVRIIDGGTDCGTGMVIEHKGELVAVRMDAGFVLWIDVNQIEVLPENGELSE